MATIALKRPERNRCRSRRTQGGLEVLVELDRDFAQDVELLGGLTGQSDAQAGIYGEVRDLVQGIQTAIGR